MTGPFYDDLVTSVSPAVAREMQLLFKQGEWPRSPWSLEHYGEAVIWHKAGDIADPELSAVALLVSLQFEAGATQGNLLQKLGAAEIEAAFAYYPQHRLPPFLKTLACFRLRRIKGMAREALLGWSCGYHPGMLVMGRVSAHALLEAQARGVRPVGIGLPLGEFREVDAGYPGGFTHHDLCHLAKFRGDLNDAREYAGQVGFFAAFYQLVCEEPALLTTDDKVPVGLDISLVASDTNGDVRLLVTLFFARLLAQRGVSEEGQVQEILSSYLIRMGMEADLALKAAPLFCTQRSAFLAEVAPYFEAVGSAILAQRRLGGGVTLEH